MTSGRRFRKITILVLAVAMMIAPFAQAWAAPADVQPDSGSTAKLYAKKDRGSTVVATLPKGTDVDAGKKDGSWYPVTVTLSGYIHDSLVTTAKVSAIKTPSANGAVNFRIGPGTDYKVIRVLPNGTQLTIVEKGSKWTKVKVGDKTGYVSTQYVGTKTTSKTSATANFRKGAGTDTTVYAKLPKGTALTLGDKSGSWYKAKVSLKGYMSAKDIETKAAEKTATITAPKNSPGTVNMRKGPGTSYGVRRVLNRGDKVTVLGNTGRWYKVSFKGDTGYVSKEFLKF